MKKKVLIKWIIGCGMLCMMLLVLWKRTHINYDEYSEKTSDMQHEEVEEIRFPDYINEKVSDGLVFDAEVVIGENFDPDNFYVSTARIMKPDEEKWKQETRPFEKTNDSFKKIVVVEKSIKPRRDDKGYVMIGIKEFLLNNDSLDI